jgi:hypothetical protein
MFHRPFDGAEHDLRFRHRRRARCTSFDLSAAPEIQDSRITVHGRVPTMYVGFTGHLTSSASTCRHQVVQLGGAPIAGEVFSTLVRMALPAARRPV